MNKLSDLNVFKDNSFLARSCKILTKTAFFPRNTTLAKFLQERKKCCKIVARILQDVFFTRILQKLNWLQEFCKIFARLFFLWTRALAKINTFTNSDLSVEITDPKEHLKPWSEMRLTLLKKLQSLQSSTGDEDFNKVLSFNCLIFYVKGLMGFSVSLPLPSKLSPTPANCNEVSNADDEHCKTGACKIACKRR